MRNAPSFLERTPPPFDSAIEDDETISPGVLALAVQSASLRCQGRIRTRSTWARPRRKPISRHSISRL